VPAAPRRLNSGFAVSRESQNTEASITSRLAIEIPHRLGPCDDVCTGCNALHWKEERPDSASKSGGYAYRECCQKGQVNLPAEYAGMNVTPQFVHDLMTQDTEGESMCLFFYYNLLT
jgi:hypothetical protein